MSQYPTLYGKKDIDLDDQDAEETDSAHVEKRQMPVEEDNLDTKENTEVAEKLGNNEVSSKMT